VDKNVYFLNQFNCTISFTTDCLLVVFIPYVEGL